MKLKLEDIVVLNEGQQANLDEISQLKKLVNKIYTSIFLYKEANDLALLEKIYQLVQQYSLINERSLVIRCIAKHHYYRNNTQLAIELYQKALNDLPIKYTSTRVILNVELAEHLYMEHRVVEAEKHYSIAESYIDDPNVSSRALYAFYFKKGIMHNSSGHFEQAKEYFNTALDFAKVNTEYFSETGAVLVAIGSAFAREGNYKDAKDFYFRSLFYFHANDINGRGAAINNISEVYCKLGDYENAIEYIENAMYLFGKEGITNKYLICTETYAETKLLLGDFSGCYKYFFVLKMTLDTSISKKNIKNSIFNMINVINDIELLKKLENSVMYLISNTDNQLYKEALYSCLGRLNIKLKKKEV